MSDTLCSAHWQSVMKKKTVEVSQQQRERLHTNELLAQFFFLRSMPSSCASRALTRTLLRFSSISPPIATVESDYFALREYWRQFVLD